MKPFVPKAMKHKPPSVPKLEPKGGGRQASSGDVSKTGKVRSTEGPRP